MKKKLSFLVVLLLLIIGGIAAWWVTAIAPVDVSDKESHLFVIKPGEGIREISHNLKEQGLINNTVAFFLIVKQQKLDSKIQAGDFRLSKNMNTQTIAENLTHGSLDIWITFPEGLRAEEIADLLEENVATYDDSWREELVKHEGYLFPDTYLIPTDATVEQVITIMTNNFEIKYNQLEGNRQKQYTKDELVTIASMVEREARHDEDRPLVASVIFNRLEVDMGLYIDATVQYAIGNRTKWWPQLTDSPRNIAPNSPYNTYRHAGLPPTPISNSGLAVLEAVVSAPDTNYLYYITDKNGINRYATTLEQHNANIARYGL
ncbi:MAG TPA: endolytic transglycosylase MltG [Patescibacteria group bacterium]|nr:endolytic transglycosylase MltG [Patescibacteria group bacterium]